MGGSRGLKWIGNGKNSKTYLPSERQMCQVCAGGKGRVDGIVRRFAYPAQENKNKGNQLLPFSGCGAFTCMFSVPFALE